MAAARRCCCCLAVGGSTCIHVSQRAGGKVWPCLRLAGVLAKAQQQRCSSNRGMPACLQCFQGGQAKAAAVDQVSAPAIRTACQKGTEGNCRAGFGLLLLFQQELIPDNRRPPCCWASVILTALSLCSPLE
jgi:hypothetical protein